MYLLKTNIIQITQKHKTRVEVPYRRSLQQKLRIPEYVVLRIQGILLPPLLSAHFSTTKRDATTEIVYNPKIKAF
jgi:hypothetical protein